MDGPEEFKKELELRIKAFENMPKDQPDNPVYDVLRDRLQFQNPNEYIPKKSFDEKQRKVTALASQLEALQEQNKQLLLKQKSSDAQISEREGERVKLLEKISQLEQELRQTKQSTAPPVEKKTTITSSKPFRSEPANFSSDDVNSMLEKRGFLINIGMKKEKVLIISTRLKP